MNRTLIGVCAVFVVMLFAPLVEAQKYDPINVNLDADQARLDEVMAMPVIVRYEEKKLSEVLAELADKIGLPIYVDNKALTEAGIGIDTPVTVATPPVRVESALELILEPLDLTWMPRHGGLVITTPDGANQRLIIRVYPVYDLIVIKAGGKTGIDYDTLIETITSTLDSDSWEENGGEGTIEPFNGSLVVSQTWQSHRKVERTLNALRAAHEQAPGDWSTAVRSEFRAQQDAIAGRRTFMSPIQSNAIRSMFPGQSNASPQPETGGGLF